MSSHAREPSRGDEDEDGVGGGAAGRGGDGGGRVGGGRIEDESGDLLGTGEIVYVVRRRPSRAFPHTWDPEYLKVVDDLEWGFR